jgi:hypothetical protein
MHLNNVNRDKQKQYSNPAWKSRGNDKKETRSCYNCGKPGHLSRNCRSKKNTVIRQLNIITKGDINDEERNIVHQPTIHVNTHRKIPKMPRHNQDSNPSISRNKNREALKQTTCSIPKLPVRNTRQKIQTLRTTSR